MADIFSVEKRSAVMALIRSRGNRNTELRLIELFKKVGIKGWRRGQTLPGKPDFVFRAQRVAIFVDGCFWHGCPRHGHTPRSRLEYWAPKLLRNKTRDRAVSRELRAAGWRVLRIWECSLSKRSAERTLARVQKLLSVSTAESR